jgi:hypothetical protein
LSIWLLLVVEAAVFAELAVAALAGLYLGMF